MALSSDKKDILYSVQQSDIYGSLTQTLKLVTARLVKSVFLDPIGSLVSTL